MLLIVGQKYRMKTSGEVFELIKKQKKTMTIIARCIQSDDHSAMHQCIIRTVTNFQDQFEHVDYEKLYYGDNENDFYVYRDCVGCGKIMRCYNFVEDKFTPPPRCEKCTIQRYENDEQPK